MNEQILNYINSQHIGVLAVQLLDNSPHAATVHFGFLENPDRFIIVTSKSSKKCESLLTGKSSKASFVLGVDAKEMRTFQMDGNIEISSDDSIGQELFNKFPEKEERYNPENDVFLVFTPTWFRYSDYQSPEGKLIIES